jgi:hypothetical protein
MSIPAGVIMDSSGNEFIGLLPQEYIFRTPIEAIVANRDDSENQKATRVMVVFGIAAGALIFCCGFVAIKLYLNKLWSFYRQQSAVAAGEDTDSTSLKPALSAQSTDTTSSGQSSHSQQPTGLIIIYIKIMKLTLALLLVLVICASVDARRSKRA